MDQPTLPRRPSPRPGREAARDRRRRSTSPTPTGGSKTPTAAETVALARRPKMHSRTTSSSAIDGRARLRDRLTALLAAGVVTAPAWRHERQFFMRRTAAQEHAVLITVDPDGTERVLLDPMLLDPSGHDHARRVAAVEGGRAARLPALRGRRRGVDPAGHRRRKRRASSTARSIGAGTPRSAGCPAAQAFYYVRRLAAYRCAGRRRAVSPPRLAAPARLRPGYRRVRLRSRVRQDDVLLRVGQPRRSLADRQCVARHRAAQRLVDRRPHDVRPGGAAS